GEVDGGRLARWVGRGLPWWPRAREHPPMRAHPALFKEISWCRAGSAVFTWAALAGRPWWVLRLNDFPGHLLYSLFINGQIAGVINGLPPAWLTATSDAGPLTAGERRKVFALSVAWAGTDHWPEGRATVTGAGVQSCPASTAARGC